MTKPRREDYTCRSCRWWSRLTQIEGAVIGVCHRIVPGDHDNAAGEAFLPAFSDVSLVTAPGFGCLLWAKLEPMEEKEK